MRTGPRSFVGGEVSDRLYGRPDDPRYGLGAELLRNFLVTPTGVAQKRPGTELVRESRNSAQFRLLTFRTGQGSDIWVEMGLRTEYPATSALATYARFHSQGGTQLHSTVWSASTAYAVGNLVQHPTASGTLYRCVSSHTNQPPPNVTYWESLAYSAANNYALGALVSHSGGVYYCSQAHTSSGPVTPGTETHWYLMPASGEYEIPTPILTPNRGALFFNLTHSQQGDALSFASGWGPPSELRPISGGWTWTTVTFAPTLPAPTGVAAVATKRGQTYAINYAGAAGSGPYTGSIAIVTSTNVALNADVDTVFIEGSIAALNGKPWRVTGVLAAGFVPIDPETGAPVAYGGAPVFGGTIRYTNLNSSEDNSYVVTAVDATGRESQASTAATVANNLFTTGALNTVTWNAVTGASRYRVYKKDSGTSLYGVVGQTSGLSFADGVPSIAPSLGEPPPILDTSLDAQQPRAVAHYEARRWFASPGANRAQDVWGTKSNTESDLSYALPLRATDRIQQRIKGRLGCNILHMVPMAELIVLTDTTEFRITSPNSDALTPESFVARPQSYVGASGAQPDIIGNVLLFAAARGGHILQFGFSSDAGGYLTDDICVRAPHLFDGLVPWQLSAQRAPVPILWVVRSDGVLLGCTYVPGQQIVAWHQHDTAGAFETAAAGLDQSEDRLYVGVQRTIGGVTKRFVERVGKLSPVAWDDGLFVDCGLRYSGSEVAAVSGLSHLEGETVAVFADGLVQSQKVVTGGEITLDVPASKVAVGLPFDALAKTVPATFAIEAYGSGRPKSVSEVWVRVTQSGSFSVGISDDDLMPVAVPLGEFYAGQTHVRVPNEWTADGQLVIASTDPVPLQLVSYTAEIEVAG